MIVDVRAEVVSNTRLSADYNVVGLAASEIAARVEAGQFVMIKPAPGHDPLLRRPFSVFELLRDPSGKPRGITLLNKRVGPGTSRIFEAAAGERLPCLGPLGRPFRPVDPPTAAWLVAGGVGLAPFALLAETLARRGTRTTLFYGGRRASDLLYLDLFRGLGVRLALATEDGTLGARGQITLHLERDLRDETATTPLMLYACGPEGMLAAVARLARLHGRPCQVSVERMMGCGLGGCYSCVVQVRDGSGARYVRSCLAGPVFEGQEIVWT